MQNKLFTIHQNPGGGGGGAMIDVLPWHKLIGPSAGLPENSLNCSVVQLLCFHMCSVIIIG